MSDTATPTYKIIIVSGQEFSIDPDMDIEAVRAYLTPQFPDLATAKIDKGTRDVGGMKVETVEFVKKAGTKGMEGADVAALLSTITPSDTDLESTSPLLVRLAEGQLTFGEGIDNWPALARALNAASGSDEDGEKTEEKRLCSDLDALPAATGVTFGW